MPAALRSTATSEMIAIEVRFVSSLTKFSESPRFAERIEVAPETTIGDLIARYGLPVDEIARALCNGRDLNPGT